MRSTKPFRVPADRDYQGMYPTVLVTAAAFERLQGDAVISNVDAPTPSPYLSKHLVSAAHDAADPTMPSHENSTRDDRRVS